MQNLPMELLVDQIIPQLEPRDIGNLCQVNKFFRDLFEHEYTWRKIYTHRFDSQELTEFNGDYKRAYQFKTQLIISFADFNIVWLNRHYWSIETSNQSPYGKFARLHAVCWLDISYTFKSLPRGSYQLFYRLRFRNSMSSLANLSINADPVAKHTHLPNNSSSASLSLENFMHGNSDWQICSNPSSLLRINQEFQDVKISLVDHSARWKYGLDLDSVVFRKVTENSCGRKILTLQSEIDYYMSDYFQFSHNRQPSLTPEIASAGNVPSTNEVQLLQENCTLI